MESDLYQRALRILALRSHSREELRKKLLRLAGRRRAAVGRVLDELQQRGYLDDQAFALESVRLARRRLWGNQRIRRHLKGRGIDATMISRVLEQVESESQEAAGLQEVIRRWTEKFGTPETASRLKKLYEHCVRLGYHPEAVRVALAPCFEKISWNETV